MKCMRNHWETTLLLICLLALAPTLSAQQGAHIARVDGPGSHSNLGSDLCVTTDCSVSPDGSPDIVARGGNNTNFFSVQNGNVYGTHHLVDVYGQLESGVDLDGDGWDEIKCGKSVYSGNPLGDRVGTFETNNEWTSFYIGDINDDGIEDIATYMDKSPQEIKIYSGHNIDIGNIHTDSAGTGQMGYCSAPASDINGDGFNDFVTTEPGTGSSAGVLYALSGGTLSVTYGGNLGNVLWEFHGETSGDGISTVINMGDLDGDFIDDFAVCSPWVDTTLYIDCGRIYIVSGADGVELARFDGFDNNLQIGNEYRLSAGDLTADGQCELIVGLPYYDHSGMTDAGAVRVYKWDGSGLTLWRAYDGDNANDQFGWRIAWGGDLIGDGFQYFVASARYADPPGKTNAGSVYVFRGSNLPDVPMIDAPANALWGQDLPVELFNARPKEYALLLVSRSSNGCNLFGAPFDIGWPAYIAAVGGRVPLTGCLDMEFLLPNLPGSPNMTIYLEGMIVDPSKPILKRIESTNMVDVLVQ